MSAVIQRLRYIWQHPANRDRRLASIARAVRWQVHKRLIGGSWEVQVPGGARIRCYPDSQSATLLLYCNGLYDYREMRFVRDYLRPGDRFLDIGANVGIYTLLGTLAVGPTGSVDAFEPVPATLQRLRENLRLNAVQNVHVHEAAVGAEAGMVLFEIGNDAMNHLAGETGTSESGASETARTLEVNCVVLDDYLSDPSYALGNTPWARSTSRVPSRSHCAARSACSSGRILRSGCSKSTAC
jgi:FkbM family methyltransferase